MITDTAKSRRHLTFGEAADAHRAMMDAIRIVSHYCTLERDAGNEAQVDALERHLARLAIAQYPLSEYARAF